MLICLCLLTYIVTFCRPSTSYTMVLIIKIDEEKVDEDEEEEDKEELKTVNGAVQVLIYLFTPLPIEHLLHWCTLLLSFVCFVLPPSFFSNSFVVSVHLWFI